MNELVIINDNQAVTTSIMVAENFEKRHDHILRDIEKLEKDVPNFGEMYFKSEALDAYGRNRKIYYLNRDGFTLLAMGFNGKKALDFKLKYINQFNKMENQLKNQTPSLPTTYKEALQKLLIEVEKNEQLEIENKELVKEVEYKEDVIVGLVDEITLAEKRQLINRVVRSGGQNKTQERWTELYKQFEQKYHINLKLRLERYNQENKPKLKNRLDYIDKKLSKIPELYEIACKLYENDIKALMDELYGLQN